MKKKDVYLVGTESNRLEKSGKEQREKKQNKKKEKKNTPRGRDGRFLGSNKAID
jgi:hypothetical protein